MGWERNYEGKHFSWTASSGGFHCWSLVRTVYQQEAGIEIPEYGDISAEDLGAVARQMGNGAGLPPFSTRISAEAALQGRAAQEFDVVVMSGRPRDADGRVMRRANCHVGVMVDRRMLIHVEAGSDVLYVPLTHPGVRWRLVALYRHEALLCRTRQPADTTS